MAPSQRPLLLAATSGLLAAAPGAVQAFVTPRPLAQQQQQQQVWRRPSTCRAGAVCMYAAEDLKTTAKMDGDALMKLPAQAKGLLYLATDKGEDRGVDPAGFETVVQATKGSGLQALHLPVDVKYGLSLSLADQALAALDSLPSPTVITCSSNGRASAVKTMRKALQDGLDRDQALSWARSEGLPFLKNALLTDWVAARIAKEQFKGREPLLVRPLYEETSWTYSYLLACPKTKEAVIIDPVDLTVDRDIQVCEEMGLKLKYAINTHCHADHVTGSGLLHRKVPGCQSVVAEASGAEANLKIKDGDRLWFGERFVEARSTPGHTKGCMSFVTDCMSMVFTGDALLIRGCGRTDFQQGDPVKLYESIWGKIWSLPHETIVYPGHDYKGRLFTTVGEEKRFNPRLVGKSQEQFVDIMNNLKLAYPKKIDQALPSNRVDGLLGHGAA